MGGFPDDGLDDGLDDDFFDETLHSEDAEELTEGETTQARVAVALALRDLPASARDSYLENLLADVAVVCDDVDRALSWDFSIPPDATASSRNQALRIKALREALSGALSRLRQHAEAADSVKALRSRAALATLKAAKQRHLDQHRAEQQLLLDDIIALTTDTDGESS